MAIRRVGVVVLLGFVAAQQNPSRHVDITTRPVVERGADYKLVWADEFETDGKPDPEKWSYERGFIRNGEKQFYTDRLENVRVEKGVLVIEARREKYADGGKEAEYTSGSIETLARDSAEAKKGAAAKGNWKYGRIEVRAKFGQARGTWPAIWMLGNWGETGEKFKWPDHGEIDIMENVGMTPGVVHGTVHTKAYNHVKKTAVGKAVDLADVSTEFHVYGAEWTAEKIDFMIDGRVYFTFEKEAGKGTAEWPFDYPHWLKLNFAVGGGWGGQKGIDEGAWPQKMEVDWVRVYQK